MTNTPVCPYCGERPIKRKTCGRELCQQAHKREYEREKYSTNKEYRESRRRYHRRKYWSDQTSAPARYLSGTLIRDTHESHTDYLLRLKRDQQSVTPRTSIQPTLSVVAKYQVWLGTIATVKYITSVEISHITSIPIWRVRDYLSGRRVSPASVMRMLHNIIILNEREDITNAS